MLITSNRNIQIINWTYFNNQTDITKRLCTSVDRSKTVRKLWSIRRSNRSKNNQQKINVKAESTRNCNFGTLRLPRMRKRSNSKSKKKNPDSSGTRWTYPKIRGKPWKIVQKSPLNQRKMTNVRLTVVEDVSRSGGITVHREKTMAMVFCAWKSAV